MKLIEVLKVAWRGVRAHKLRSFLTTLGVVISVWTIVAVLSVISGMNNFVLTRIFTLSPDVFYVTNFGIIRSREEFLEAVKRKPISQAEVVKVGELCESCGDIGELIEGSRPVHANGRRISDVPLGGTTANFASLQNLDIEAGRYFSELENQDASPVAVIGSEVKDELFSHVDPIGRTVWVGDAPHRVIGLLTKQGSVLGQNPDLQVYVPLRTAQKQLGRGRTRIGDGQITMLVRAKDGVPSVEKTKAEIAQLFRWFRHTPFRGGDPVAFVTAEMISSLWRGISFLASGVLVIVSGLSLIVGAIVVANIMLVSVIERTKEIGLRLALGARKKDLRRQFLLEAAMLSIGGGAVGSLAGGLTALLVDAHSPFPASVNPATVVLAMSVAGFAGIVAGFFPALKASRMPPIEALRHE